MINPDGSGETRLTHSDRTHETFPAWSPDGSRITFVSEESGIPKVIKVDGERRDNPNVPPRLVLWSCVVPRRQPNRLPVPARRQPRDLRDER